MKLKIKYFIAYYGPTFARAWDDAGRRWVPYGMRLYISYFEDIAEAFAVLRRVRRACSGWHDDILIDSVLTV